MPIVGLVVLEITNDISNDAMIILNILFIYLIFMIFKSNVVYVVAV